MKTGFIAGAICICLSAVKPSQAAAPVASTFPATELISIGATLNGRVSPGNLPTVVEFEYGVDTTYGNFLDVEQGEIDGDVNTPVTAVVRELNRNTGYHYRVKATNADGTSYGDDMSFTTPACTMLGDGGFEKGYKGYWAQTSTNFESPLFGCDPVLESCASAPPFNGYWLAWFGGISGVVEEGSLTQEVLIPHDPQARLTFYLHNPDGSGNRMDFFKVRVDGNEIFSVLEGSAEYANGYVQVDRDIAQYADGGCHTLRFESKTYGALKDTSFFLDDVDICVPTVKLDGTTFASLQAAADAAQDGSIMLATSHTFNENLRLYKAGSITLNGGYNCGFATLADAPTIVTGELAVEGSDAVVESMKVRGSLAVRSGSLRVGAVSVM